MEMKNIIVINGHPDKQSFCGELAIKYSEGAKKSGTDCKLINLIDLEFDPILKYGYKKRTELEPDLLKIQEEIKNADHLVFVYPNWWGTFPALLKGFIDRVFLPKFAFSYREDSLLWDKLLTNKTARLLVTMDTPKWYYSFIYGKPGHNSMKKSILNFCGIKPVKITSFGPIKNSNNNKRKLWLEKAERLGEQLN
jgi:putative NADPH-quinone reductase